MARSTTNSVAARRTGKASARRKGATRSTLKKGKASTAVSRKKAGRRARMGAAGMPLLIVVAALAVGAYLLPMVQMEYASQREVERLETELAGLTQRNQELEADVERLRTPAGVEQAAREMLGLVKPGENAYVVMETGQGSEPGREAEEAARTESADPWWLRTLDKVFGVER